MTNKVALITGGSSGIGRATALRLSKECETIIITYSKNKKEADEVVNEIMDSGKKAFNYQLNAEKFHNLDELMNTIYEDFGNLDIVVNAIGVSRIGLLEELDFSKDWRYCVDVNLNFLFLLIQKVLPIMKTQGWGRFINISSVSAFETRDGVAAYSVTKSAQNSLIKFFAKEAGKYNICVNSICPGMTETNHLIQSNKKLADISGKTLEEINNNILKDTYLGKMLKPEEIAEYVSFLISNSAANITGQSLVMAGGRG